MCLRPSGRKAGAAGESPVTAARESAALRSMRRRSFQSESLDPPRQPSCASSIRPARPGFVPPSRMVVWLRRVRFPRRRGEHGHGLFTLAARFHVEESEDLSAGIRDLELLVVELDRAELGGWWMRIGGKAPCMGLTSWRDQRRRKSGLLTDSSPTSSVSWGSSTSGPAKARRLAAAAAWRPRCRRRARGRSGPERWHGRSCCRARAAEAPPWPARWRRARS
jgi:hypothetical protein